jgi:hypothetical protein
MDLIILRPMLRVLNDSSGGEQHLVIPFENLFRQAECWRYTAVCDRGYSKKEHADMYASFDRVFHKVFVRFSKLTRLSSGKCLMAFILLAYREIIQGRLSKRKNLRGQLIQFLEELDHDLRKTGQLSVSEGQVA